MNKRPPRLLTTLVLPSLLVLTLAAPAPGGWLDVAKDVAGKALSKDAGETTNSSSSSSLSDSDVISGLKQALEKAVDNAIASLGQDGGYLNNLDVKIPMPERLQTVEKAARAIGQDELADEFIASMNSAAEQAVPETVSIFTDAISKMSFSDARSILGGEDDAATAYFKKNSSDALFDKILPLVEKATSAVGVTSNYKTMMSSISTFGSAVGMETTDLDTYVTQKAIAGLFTVMADEEKAIRDNPAKRTTELLQKVFGSLD